VPTDDSTRPVFFSSTRKSFGPRNAIVLGKSRPLTTVRTPRLGSTTAGTDCAPTGAVAEPQIILALDMHECMARYARADGDGTLQLRIGINSGPVVAGVIGRRRFLYDVWGDAVNMASRMESHGLPGKIQITRTTWELVRDEFECETRGVVDVKGKGQVETWYLLGPRPPATPGS
jgi:class 3 adenylate cyclase